MTVLDPHTPAHRLPVLTEVVMRGHLDAPGTDPAVPRAPAVPAPVFDPTRLEQLEQLVLERVMAALSASLEQRVHGVVGPAVQVLADRLAYKAAQEIGQDLVQSMRQELQQAVTTAVQEALKDAGLQAPRAGGPEF